MQRWLNFLGKFGILIGLCLWLGQAFAADIQVRVDRNPVGFNESFLIEFSAGRKVDADPDFSVLEPYIEILNQSQSSSVNIINGRYKASTSWLLTAMPKQQGELVLPAVSFGNDKSAPLTLRVEAAADRPDEQSAFFTRVRVNTQQLYAQQQLVVTQQLFSAYALSAHEFRDISYTGVEVVSELLGDIKRYTTRVGQRAYSVVERQFAVFPQSSGELTIGATVAGGRQRAVGGLAYDPFGGSNRILSARSKPLKIEVLPIPGNANMNPWLPADSLELVEQWPQDPPQFVEGEPVTRTLSLKAEGLSSAQLPELPTEAVDGLKAYPDQAMLNDVHNDTGVTGYRVQKVAFIATRSGRIELPPMEIPWWDTKAQTRRVARIPARVIEVKPAQGESQVPQVSAAESIDEPVPVEEDKPLSIASLPIVTTSTSAVWPLLTVFMTIGWLLTTMAWIYQSKTKASPTSARNNLQRSLRKQHAMLVAACKQQDVSACRRELLAWGQQLFAQQKITGLHDLLVWLPQPLADEIRKIDAVLYGQQDAKIDFVLIQRQSRELMAKMEKSPMPSPDLLEPLYK